PLPRPPTSPLSPYTTLFRSLLVHPELTTLYAKRSVQMHDRMAQQIAAIAAAVPGNVALFFPSYELLEEAHSRFLALRVGKRILVDRKSTRLNSSHEWISYAV